MGEDPQLSDPQSRTLLVNLVASQQAGWDGAEGGGIAMLGRHPGSRHLSSTIPSAVGLQASPFQLQIPVGIGPSNYW